MTFRMVAGLNFQSIDFASVRDPAGSPEFTYDRMISFRMSRALESSSRPSLFATIAFFYSTQAMIGSMRRWGRWVRAEFNREIFLERPDERFSKLLNRGTDGKK